MCYFINSNALSYSFSAQNHFLVFFKCVDVRRKHLECLESVFVDRASCRRRIHVCAKSTNHTKWFWRDRRRAFNEQRAVRIIEPVLEDTYTEGGVLKPTGTDFQSGCLQDEKSENGTTVRKGGLRAAIRVGAPEILRAERVQCNRCIGCVPRTFVNYNRRCSTSACSVDWCCTDFIFIRSTFKLCYTDVIVTTGLLSSCRTTYRFDRMM